MSPWDLSGNARRIADVLAVLDATGRPWQALVTTTCPYCESPGAWLRVASDGAPFADCPDGCTSDTIAQALAGHVVALKADRENGR